MYGKTEIKVTKVTKGKQKLNYIKKLPDLRESKKSVEFWIPSRGILTFVGETWIPVPRVVFWIPKPKNPDSTSKNVTDSEI